MAEKIVRQSRFTGDGVEALPEGVTVEDLKLQKKWGTTQVLCPYCLHLGDLWSFSTRLKNKRKNHFVSMSKFKCPDCKQGFMKKTLMKVAGYSMEEFSTYFWENMFSGFGFGDKVIWDKFKDRLKKHFTSKKNQVFWRVYWEFKNPQMEEEEEPREKRSVEQGEESPSQADQLAVNIEVIKELLMSWGRPATVSSIKYMSGMISSRQVTRALETMEKEGMVVHVKAGWKLYRGKKDV